MNLVRHLSSGFDESRCREVVQRIEPFGWHLELHVDADDLGRLRRFVEDSPINVVIDHMGRVDAALGTDQPPFRTLLKLISCPHCWVKLSGADRLAKRCPLETAVSFARPLMEVAPDRVVWGTDWPHVNHEQPQSDAALINLLAEIAPDDISRTRLLVAPETSLRLLTQIQEVEYRRLRRFRRLRFELRLTIRNSKGLCTCERWI